MNGCHFAPYFLWLLHKKIHFLHFQNKYDIWKIKLQTQLGNIVFPYQDATTGQIWALYHKLCVLNEINLVIWLWNPFMFIDDRPSSDQSLCKVWEISFLSFSLTTSGHSRSLCQRIYFLSFFHFFDFFEKLPKWPT